MSSAAGPGMAPIQRTRMSAAAVTGFVFGLLMCLPLVGGFFAILFSAIGIHATRDPVVKGRGLAIAGLILGIMSVCAWLGVGGIVGVVLWSTAAPRAAIQDFAGKVVAGDLTGAAAVSGSTLSSTDLDNLHTKFTGLGTFEGLTSIGTNMTTSGGVGTCRITGVIRFSGVRHAFEADLENSGGSWKVEHFYMRK